MERESSGLPYGLSEGFGLWDKLCSTGRHRSRYYESITNIGPIPGWLPQGWECESCFPIDDTDAAIGQWLLYQQAGASALRVYVSDELLFEVHRGLQDSFRLVGYLSEHGRTWLTRQQVVAVAEAQHPSTIFSGLSAILVYRNDPPGDLSAFEDPFEDDYPPPTDKPFVLEDDWLNKGLAAAGRRIERLRKHFGKPPAPPRYAFKKQGGVYEVHFEGEFGYIPAELNGAQYVEKLLKSPGRQVHVCDLTDATRVSVVVDEAENRIALNKCRDRYRDICAEIERIKEDHSEVPEDLYGDREEIENEMLRLADYRGKRARMKPANLRSKRSSDTSANQSVRIGVKNAIDRLLENCRSKYVLTKFADHIDTAINRGWHCSYKPNEPAPDWLFS